MPCWALASTFLIILVLDAVNASSSLIRSRMGRICRCTYALRANGWEMRFTALGSSPSQKSPLSTGRSGSLPVVSTLCEAGAVRSADAAGCGLEFELVCRANAETASTADKSRVTNMLFFTSTSCEPRPCDRCWRCSQLAPLPGQRPDFLLLRNPPSHDTPAR